MPKFQIVMPHDPAQCMDALEEVLDHDPAFFSQVFYGCHFGDCTGYALVEASSEEEARSKVPITLRKRARVVGVEPVGPEEIRSVHTRGA